MKYAESISGATWCLKMHSVEDRLRIIHPFFGNVRKADP